MESSKSTVRFICITTYIGTVLNAQTCHIVLTLYERNLTFQHIPENAGLRNTREAVSWDRSNEPRSWLSVTELYRTVYCFYAFRVYCFILYAQYPKYFISHSTSLDLFLGSNLSSFSQQSNSVSD